MTHTVNRSKLISEELDFSSANVLCYNVLVIAPVVFADSLFLLANLDPVDINFHQSGSRYIATLIRVVKYQTRRGNLCRLATSLLSLGSSKTNQHCWRFHDSGVIAAPQIIGLISFCTGMHHEYFLRSSMCFRVPHLCSKIPKINNWTGEFATVIWRLHCFTVSFRGDVRGESGPR